MWDCMKVLIVCTGMLKIAVNINIRDQRLDFSPRPYETSCVPTRIGDSASVPSWTLNLERLV